MESSIHDTIIENAELESFFNTFRKNTIGSEHYLESSAARCESSSLSVCRKEKRSINYMLVD